MLGRDIVETPHEQLADPRPPRTLGDVQLFKIQRSREPGRRPQE